MYNEKIMDHFQNPRNMGEIEGADAVGKVGNIICGDLMHLYIKVGKNDEGEEIVEDIKYKTLGCVAAISTSSMVAELAKSKTIPEALKIDKEMIANELGGLPKIKYHCSILAADALAEAIYDYLSKNKKEIPDFLEKKHQIAKKTREAIEEKQNG
ncbi:MAG: iron-sulfur cluster assembly scaffold protein [Patescibacteria group bacterium]|nr:iron-sulfur cluster assembly scaffold protein [Patescibacteria group bacterium]